MTLIKVFNDIYIIFLNGSLVRVTPNSKVRIHKWNMSWQTVQAPCKLTDVYGE